MLTAPEDLARYDTWVKGHVGGSLWQSLEWKAFQEALGREVRIYAVEEGGKIVSSAIVVIDRTSFGLSAWDIPHGPLWHDGETARAFLASIVDRARGERAMTVRCSPSEPLLSPSLQWHPAGRLVYAQVTRMIDLALSEEDILAQMREKGRYNIRVAERNGIVVEQSRDTAVFHRLLRQTGARDAFRIHPEHHYRLFVEKLPGSFLLIARDNEKKPIAGLLGVIWKETGIYYYGAFSYEQRALMAPYLLQWEAMKLCKSRGCASYDLLGIAPSDASPDHPWTGISDFKRKFGGSIITCPPEQQIILRPMAHRLLQLKRAALG
ncbi:MAG: FemAB family protein [Candidatus Peregrinibacteria bacterium Greene0416_19]|nr:MAG: FemAB family protein [Candidatus Peregrinibacteria bacterium Greene0416_19]